MKKVVTIRLSETDLQIIDYLKDQYAMIWPDQTRTTLTTTEVLTFALRYLYTEEQNKSNKKDN